MARRRSSIKGDFKLRALLRRIHADMDNELRPAMMTAANLVLDTQRRLIPVDTGEARNALQAKVLRGGLDAQIGLRGKKDNRRFFYLRFIEYGTKGYPGHKLAPGETMEGTTIKKAGNRNRRKTVKSDGESFFGAYPDIPARPAHPWLRPSIDMNRDEIREIIAKAISSTLERAARGLNE